MEAEAIYEHALQGKEKALGPDHPSTLITTNNLGNLYRDQGRIQEAETLYRRALQGYEKAIAENITPSIGSLENMEDFAKFQVQQGKTHEARSLYIRCQEGLKAVLGIEHSRYKAMTREIELLSEDGGR